MDSTDLTPTSFVQEKPKGLLIDGKWVQSVSGETMESINPATGKVIGCFALGDARDVDLAVDSARRALEGPWARFTPADRQRVLLKLADLIECEFEQLAVTDTLDMGMPIAASNSPALASLVTNTFRFAAGQAVAFHGESLPNSLPGNILSYTKKEPVGVVGGIIPWNGPAAIATLGTASSRFASPKTMSGDWIETVCRTERLRRLSREGRDFCQIVEGWERP